MTKPGRNPCVVIGCRRTAPVDLYPAGTLIICGKCWRLASRETRQRWTDTKQLLARARRRNDLRLEDRLCQVIDRIFERVRLEANDARAGIG